MAVVLSWLLDKWALRYMYLSQPLALRYMYLRASRVSHSSLVASQLSFCRPFVLRAVVLRLSFSCRSDMAVVLRCCRSNPAVVLRAVVLTWLSF